MIPPEVSSYRTLFLSVYLPTILFAVGQGAITPVVALAADDLGAGAVVASLAVVSRGVGQLLFNLPAGKLVSLIGERLAMIAATGLLAVSLVGSLLTDSPPVFVAWMFVVGCAWSVWQLARLSYVTEVVPAHERGRALSTLGGCQRIGSFVGPFIGAWFMLWFDLAGAFYLHILTAVMASVALAVVRSGAGGHGAVPVRGEGPAPRVAQLLVEHRRNLTLAGIPAIVISAMRASRPVVIPLWAVSIGLDAHQVSIIFGISAAIDMALFYPAGVVSDRWGRRASATATIAPMMIGFLLIPFTAGYLALIAVGVIIGIGNGMGSGIVMTLGSDLAPPVGRVQLLGLWRLITDVGTVGGPLLVAGVQWSSGLAAASVAMGVLGITGTAMAATKMPNLHPGHRRVKPAG